MLALLENAQQDLINLNFEKILTYLREFLSKVDGPSIMTASLTISLKRHHIQKYATEFQTLFKSGKIHLQQIHHRPSGFESIDDSSIASSRDLGSLPNVYKAQHFVSKLRNSGKEIVVDDFSKRLIPIIGTSKFAVMLHNVLTLEECSNLIQRVEDEGFEDALVSGPGNKQILQTDIRSCQHCMIDDNHLAEDLFKCIIHALKETDLGSKFQTVPWCSRKDSNNVFEATGFNERLHFLKYEVGNFFAALQDNRFKRGPEHRARAGEISHVTIQIYLNEKFKGGATRMKAS